MRALNIVRLPQIAIQHTGFYEKTAVPDMLPQSQKFLRMLHQLSESNPCLITLQEARTANYYIEERNVLKGKCPTLDSA